MDNDGGTGGILLFLLFLVVFGAIGAWLGNRNHGQPVLGFIAGMMCGPIGLLLMFLVPSNSVKCQFCKSVLNPGASVCHKCGRDQLNFAPMPPSGAVPRGAALTSRAGLTAGRGFAVLIAVLLMAVVAIIVAILNTLNS